MKIRVFCADFDHVNQIRGNSVVVNVMSMPLVGQRIRLEGFVISPHIRFFQVNRVTYPATLSQQDVPLVPEVQVDWLP